MNGLKTASCLLKLGRLWLNPCDTETGNERSVLYLFLYCVWQNLSELWLHIYLADISGTGVLIKKVEKADFPQCKTTSLKLFDRFTA